MPASISPSVRRRRLAIELRQLRESAPGKQTVSEVGRALSWSPSKVSRYELGRSGLNPDEVLKLLDYYHVVDPKRGQLLALAHDAAQKGWWEDYADAISEQYMEFVGLEAEATSVWQYQIEVLPGLLQTEDYARQVVLGYRPAAPVPPGVAERRVQVRMIRQQALTRDPPLELSVVLDESTLLRKICDRPVMYAQLQRLAEAAELPNVTIQVLPLNTDRSLVAASFAIHRFGPEGPEGGTMLHDVVSTESLREEFYLEDDAVTYEHWLAFRGLSAGSLDPTESRKLILKLAKQVWLS
jgi:transcriptional regulator with XRE-family HTH domain